MPILRARCSTITSQKVSRKDDEAISPPLFYDLKRQSANEQISITDQRAAIENAKLNLPQLLNMTYNKSFKVAHISAQNISIKFPQSPEEIYTIALINFARIKIAKMRTESAEKRIEAAKGLLFQSLNLGGNLNINYSNVASRSFLVYTVKAASADYVMVNDAKNPVVVQQINF